MSNTADPLPPELLEKIREIAVEESSAHVLAAILEACPLIVAHVARRDAEICREQFDYLHGISICAEAIEREWGI
jgi:hypothetical protein